MQHQQSGSFLIGGSNYGQGSSREHAAIAPRYLGVRAVIAKSYARIHRKNLINFGIAPFLFADEHDHDWIDQGDVLEIKHLHQAIRDGEELSIHNKSKRRSFLVRYVLSPREKEELLSGGLVNYYLKNQHN